MVIMGRGSRLLVFVWSLIISIETPLLEEIPNKKDKDLFSNGEMQKRNVSKKYLQNY